MNIQQISVLLITMISLEAQQKQAFMLYRTGKYPEATAAFKQAVAKDPLDASLQYYLGLSALYAKDYKTAERALCCVVVESPPNSAFAKSAITTLSGWRHQFHGLNVPYSQQPDGMRRWAKNINVPIKVFVSDGLQLPKGYYAGDLNMDRCRELYPRLMNKSFYASLRRAPRYVPAYRDAVIRGVGDWKFLEKEGIVKIEFVEDPTKADVVYVWTKQHGGGHVGVACYPWTGVPNARCIVEVETDSPNSWGASAPIRLRETSAHEFGHILGLANHSENAGDVMCGYGQTISYWKSRQYENINPVTRNDFVTLRALYDLPVDTVYAPQAW